MCIMHLLQRQYFECLSCGLFTGLNDLYFNILYKARDWEWGWVRVIHSYIAIVPKIGCTMNNKENIIYDISRVHQLAVRFGEAFICFTEFILLAHQGVVTPLFKCGFKGLTT